MPGLDLERQIQTRGYRLVAGIDEAGRGPLAGPVVAAAVVLPPGLAGDEPWLKSINDSKRLSPAQRERALELIHRNALAVGVGRCASGEIDTLGILPATIEAMMQAIESLSVRPEHLLFDYIPLKTCEFPFQTVVKGDSISYSIAAASIVAKVTRDRWMQQAEELYPGYGFVQHKGYPTASHISRLKELGPCSIHRRSFAPVRDCINAAVAYGV
ncbi:MAG: ribonuclease HII [Chloroflexi bacterium]|nr:ribonuclease HII [Chloroflexota bacterium]MDA1219086.1 ribonuclease HII [Chloroflexota bacterium]